MTRTVFDTSAIVKILASPARSLLLAKILQAHKLYTSNYILDEVERVLVGKFGKTKARAKSITLGYAKICTVINPPAVKHLVRDCSDSPIIDLCIKTRAGLLVTNDKDLLSTNIPGCQCITFEVFFKNF